MTVTATLRKNLGPPMPNRMMTHVFRKTKSRNQHALFVACQIDVESKQLFSPLSWNNPLSKIKFHSLISLKGTRLLWDICLYDISPVNGLKTFYIDIKTIERVKKQTMFQRKMADFKGKQPENYKHWKCTIYKILSLYEHLCSTFFTSVLVCL